VQVVDGNPVGADLRYEGSAHSRRGRADTISKVLFQYLARREPLTLQTLLDASQTGLLQAGMQT
jgi:snurportin-1